MSFSPSPLTAALAGLFSGLAWPLLWSRYVGAGSDGTMAAVLITLGVIALPAHLFVVGLRPRQTVPARGLDTALLKRIGAWVGAAGLAALVVMLVRGQV